MRGITGIFDTRGGRAVNPAALQRMNDSQHHRGPDEGSVHILPGVHRASSVKAAEVAKVIENTQRDLSIALMNELAIIFDKIGIDTTKVLEAAGTKWNSLNSSPNRPSST